MDYQQLQAYQQQILNQALNEVSTFFYFSYNENLLIILTKHIYYRVLDVTVNKLKYGQIIKNVM